MLLINQNLQFYPKPPFTGNKVKSWVYILSSDLDILKGFPHVVFFSLFVVAAVATNLVKRRL